MGRAVGNGLAPTPEEQAALNAAGYALGQWLGGLLVRGVNPSPSEPAPLIEQVARLERRLRALPPQPFAAWPPEEVERLHRELLLLERQVGRVREAIDCVLS